MTPNELAADIEAELARPNDPLADPFCFSKDELRLTLAALRLAEADCAYLDEYAKPNLDIRTAHARGDAATAALRAYRVARSGAATPVKDGS